jgi:hypothetical protein
VGVSRASASGTARVSLYGRSNEEALVASCAVDTRQLDRPFDAPPLTIECTFARFGLKRTTLTPDGRFFFYGTEAMSGSSSISYNVQGHLDGQRRIQIDRLRVTEQEQGWSPTERWASGLVSPPVTVCPANGAGCLRGW